MLIPLAILAVFSLVTYLTWRHVKDDVWQYRIAKAIGISIAVLGGAVLIFCLWFFTRPGDDFGAFFLLIMILPLLSPLILAALVHISIGIAESINKRTKPQSQETVNEQAVKEQAGDKEEADSWQYQFTVVVFALISAIAPIIYYIRNLIGPAGSGWTLRVAVSHSRVLMVFGFFIIVCYPLYWYYSTKPSKQKIGRIFEFTFIYWATLLILSFLYPSFFFR